MPSKGTIHLIDDEEAVRRSVSMLLTVEGYEVHEFASAEAALGGSPGAPPNCVVTDVRMPGMSGLHLLESLRQRGVHAPVIVVTGHADIGLAVDTMKAGAADFLEKPFEPEALLQAVARALQAAPLDAAGAQDLHRRYALLSNRERQVLEALVQGGTNKSIAAKLQLSPRTVEIYRANVMSKMEADSLSALVHQALRAGLVDPRSTDDAWASGKLRFSSGQAS